MPSSDSITEKDSSLRCSFCGKSQEVVATLIMGPGINICDECVLLCINKLNVGESRPNEDQIATVKCSFCGKSQKQVILLIWGPGINICNICIELCAEVLDEKDGGVRRSLLTCKMPAEAEGTLSTREIVLHQIVEFVYRLSNWQQIFQHAMEEHGISVVEVESEVNKKIAEEKALKNDQTEAN